MFGSHHSGIPIYSPISMSLVSLEGVRGWLEILKMLGKTDRKRLRPPKNWTKSKKAFELNKAIVDAKTKEAGATSHC